MDMFDNLFESIEKYIQTKTIHDRERDKCDRDWSYFGHTEIEELEKAKAKVKKDFEDILNCLIDNRIEKNSL